MSTTATMAHLGQGGEVERHVEGLAVADHIVRKAHVVGVSERLLY